MRWFQRTPAEIRVGELRTQVDDLTAENITLEYQLREARKELGECRVEIQQIEELLESERVKNRIQQIEIDELAAVCVRNNERTRAEIAHFKSRTDDEA